MKNRIIDIPCYGPDYAGSEAVTKVLSTLKLGMVVRLIVNGKLMKLVIETVTLKILAV